MLLADGVNLPIVAAFGLATFGPLTLLVTLLESLVFRLHLRTRIRAVFGRILGANVLSTLAGVPLLIAQEALIYASGVSDSIPAFVRGYLWIGPLMIGAYFAKSVLIEGLWLTRRRFRERIERPAGAALRAVLLANVCSYLVVGPLFYLTMRPHFGGVATMSDTRWTANPDLSLYYIDRTDGFVRSKHVDGADTRLLVPVKATTFLISGDAAVIAYLTPDKQLYASRVASFKPLLLGSAVHGDRLQTVSISPDASQVALAEPPSGLRWMIRTADLNSGNGGDLGELPDHWTAEVVCWSADGTGVYVLGSHPAPGSDSPSQRQQQIYRFSLTPAGDAPQLVDEPPSFDALAENYVCSGDYAGWMGGWPLYGREPPRRGRYSLDYGIYLGDFLSVRKDDQPYLQLSNAHGFLNVNLPRVWPMAFLPDGTELLVGWDLDGPVHLLDLEHRRLGLLANGYRFALRTPEFRVTLSAGTRWSYGAGYPF